MEIKPGYLYFISDEFFEKIKDPYLKTNYETTKRPHYFAFLDQKTSLYWIVPCSSKVDKFQAIIDKKRASNKPTDTIKIVKIQGKKNALLFQDMFPVIEKYLSEQYIRGGQPVFIADPKQVDYLTKTAKKVAVLLHRGIIFTPTQPDINRIETIMLQELQIDRAKTEAAPTKATTLAERMVAAKEAAKDLST